MSEKLVQKNRARLLKAVYLLLQEHHTRYGLGAVGWWKEPDNLYVSFFSHALRDELGRPKHCPEVSGKYSLTIYQGLLGLPAWGAGEQYENEMFLKQDMRTAEIKEWLCRRLTLEQFFADNEDEISSWRQRYTVDEAERYLFSWNVLGLIAGGRGAVETFGYTGSMYGEGLEVPRHEMLRLLDGRHIDLHVVKGPEDFLVVATNGRSWSSKWQFRDLFKRDGLSGDRREIAEFASAGLFDQPE